MMANNDDDDDDDGGDDNMIYKLRNKLSYFKCFISF